MFSFSFYSVKRCVLMGDIVNDGLKSILYFTILDCEKVIVSHFLPLPVFVVPVCPKSGDAVEQAETAPEAGCCPGRTKIVVFYSHEVELVHILVGKNNERLTGTECAVKMLR